MCLHCLFLNGLLDKGREEGRESHNSALALCHCSRQHWDNLKTLGLQKNCEDKAEERFERTPNQSMDPCPWKL